MRDLFISTFGGVLLVVSALVLAVSNLEAQEEESSFSVKLYAGLNQAMDADLEGSSELLFPSGEASFDAGFVTGLALVYRPVTNFEAEIEYAYRTNDIDSISGVGQASGDLASVAIMANGYYLLQNETDWVPYVGLGFGLLQEIDADMVLDDTPQTDLEDRSIAWQAMVGTKYQIASSWDLLGEVRYFSAPGPELENGSGSYDLDYDNLSLNLGVAFNF